MMGSYIILLFLPPHIFGKFFFLSYVRLTLRSSGGSNLFSSSSLSLSLFEPHVHHLLVCVCVLANFFAQWFKETTVPLCTAVATLKFIYINNFFFSSRCAKASFVILPKYEEKYAYGLVISTHSNISSPPRGSCPQGNPIVRVVASYYEHQFFSRLGDILILLYKSISSYSPFYFIHLRGTRGGAFKAYPPPPQTEPQECRNLVIVYMYHQRYTHHQNSIVAPPLEQIIFHFFLFLILFY